MKLKELFIVSVCEQIDIVSLTPQNEDWLEANRVRVDVVLKTHGYTNIVVISEEASEDGLTVSLFCRNGYNSLLVKDFRGYVMNVGDTVMLEELDKEPIEILEVAHYDDRVMYQLKFISVANTITENIGI